jgi:uncharacterized membrane protein YdjX (TVP38/TMEM64 family)
MASEVTASDEAAGDGRRTRADNPSSSVAVERTRRILAILLAVIISVLIVIFRNQLAGLGAFGYPGLFLLNVFTSATIILPVPGLAFAFAAGATLNPFLVGLSVGSGAAVGELTGYLAGYGGQGLVENNPGYTKIVKWTQRYGLWVVFFLALMPNPFFDVVGMVAGLLRIPVWRFLLACWAGNLIKATTIALIGAETIMRISPLLEQWLTK